MATKATYEATVSCAVCKISWMARTVPVERWVCPSCRTKERT